MRSGEITTEVEWNVYEAHRWLNAVRERGLLLSSLDPQERLLVSALEEQNRSMIRDARRYS